MSANRLQRMQSVLERRQPDLTVAMAGVNKEHNVSAVLRSCDAVGVGEAHVLGTEGRLAVKRTAASGVRRYVALRQHRELLDGCDHLQGRGFRLVAADCTEQAVDFRAVDYTRPVALVLGRELLGIPEPVMARVDATIRIPMAGLAESLNVSVAAAVVLYEAQRQRVAAGLYDRCRLDPEVYRRTLFEWLHPRIARYCRQRGLAYPELDDDGEVAAASGLRTGRPPSLP